MVILGIPDVTSAESCVCVSADSPPAATPPIATSPSTLTCADPSISAAVLLAGEALLCPSTRPGLPILCSSAISILPPSAPPLTSSNKCAGKNRCGVACRVVSLLAGLGASETTCPSGEDREEESSETAEVVVNGDSFRFFCDEAVAMIGSRALPASGRALGACGCHVTGRISCRVGPRNATWFT